MARQKLNKNPQPESEEVDEGSDAELDDEDIGDFEQNADDYVSRAQIKEELKAKISDMEGNQKVAFAAMYELYGKQEEIDDQQQKEIEAIKHKYRLKAEQLLNRTRKIASGESTETNILSTSEILNATEKATQLKTVSVPDFWPTVIRNSSFGSLIDKTEEPAIDSIKNVIVKYNPTNQEVNIQIHFGENSIFTDSVLKATLAEETEGAIKHTYDQPKYKPHYVKPSEGFFGVFSEVPTDEAVGLFEIWLNFYQEEIPHALAFYFQLRDGTFHARTPEFDDEDYDDADEEGNVKPRAKKNIEKPECKQQ